MRVLGNGADRFLAALAGLDNHVGELLDFGGFSNVVKDREGFQILRHTARRCRRFWIDGVIEAKDVAVLGVCAPQIWTGSCTEVGVIAFGLMDPLPAQILLEVDVERA